MPFNVFVEGAQDSSPGGVRKLAHAMSQRFGIPAADLEARIASGRFRVKANVDRASAAALVTALEDIGANVVVEDTEAAAPRPSSPSLPPANRSSSPSLPPANRPQSGSMPPVSRTTTGGGQPFASGLSAAFGTERAQSEGDFRMLGGNSLSLASLDGDDAGTSSSDEQFSPAVEPVAPPVAPRTMTAQSKPAPTAPVDLFRPPDAEDDELNVALAAEEITAKEERTRKASLPPVQIASAATPAGGTPAFRRSSPAIVLAPEDTGPEPMPRGRFAAGVFLAIILGFVPAHLVAASHERGANRAIDVQVEATQASASDEDSYRALDAFRASAVERKKSERRTAMFMALGIWAVVGGGLAYAYFRRIPWDKLGRPPGSPA